MDESEVFDDKFMDKPEDATNAIQTVDDCFPQPQKQPEEFTVSLQDWMEAGPSRLRTDLQILTISSILVLIRLSTMICLQTKLMRLLLT